MPSVDEEDGVWMPPPLRAHIAKLVPGARVRIKINGECKRVGHPDSPDVRANIIGHHHEEDGLTGSIYRTHATVVGHPYAVIFDKLVFLSALGEEFKGSHYTAAELEVLDESRPVPL